MVVPIVVPSRPTRHLPITKIASVLIGIAIVRATFDVFVENNIVVDGVVPLVTAAGWLVAVVYILRLERAAGSRENQLRRIIELTCEERHGPPGAAPSATPIPLGRPRTFPVPQSRCSSRQYLHGTARR